MGLSYTFGTLTAWQAAWLDTDFAEVGACTTVPCTITGTNTLLLTSLSHTPARAAYANHQRWGGIAAADNTGATLANIDSIGLLPVYKDTAGGPAGLVGGEITSGNYIVLVYDDALNSGSGGFHLETAPSTAAGTITGVTAGAGLTGGGGSGAVTVSIASIADQRLLANVSGGAAAPAANTLSAVLDAILGTTRGSIIYRGNAAWVALAPGSQSQYLYTSGSGADPLWRGGVATGISAAGATQGTATQLAAAYNQVGTVGSGTGVILATTIGMQQWVWNDGANTLAVYPPSGAQIDNAGTNNAVTVAVGSKAGYVMISATQAKTL